MRLRPSSLQFSLRSAFIALTICAVWLAVYANPFLVRRRTIRELEAMGAAITYDYQWDENGAWRPGAIAPGVTWLKELLGENYRADVVEIQLFADQRMMPERLNDRHARGIATLTSLKWLVLMDTSLRMMA